MSAPVNNAHARWIDGERFVAGGSSGHAVVIDADRASNTAPGPMELVLMGLCACSATDLVIVLRKSRQAVTELEIRAQGERAPEPPQVYTKIHLVYRVRGRDLDPNAVERAVKLSQTKYCSVYLMLGKTAAFTHEILMEGEGAAGRGAYGAPALGSGPGGDPPEADGGPA